MSNLKQWYYRNFRDEFNRENTGRIMQILSLILYAGFIPFFLSCMYSLTKTVLLSGISGVEWQSVQTLLIATGGLFTAIALPMITYRMKKTNGKAHPVSHDIKGVP